MEEAGHAGGWEDQQPHADTDLIRGLFHHHHDSENDASHVQYPPPAMTSALAAPATKDSAWSSFRQPKPSSSGHGNNERPGLKGLMADGNSLFGLEADKADAIGLFDTRAAFHRDHDLRGGEQKGLAGKFAAFSHENRHHQHHAVGEEPATLAKFEAAFSRDRQAAAAAGENPEAAGKFAAFSLVGGSGGHGSENGGHKRGSLYDKLKQGGGPGGRRHSGKAGLIMRMVGSQVLGSQKKCKHPREPSQIFVSARTLAFKSVIWPVKKI